MKGKEQTALGLKGVRHSGPPKRSPVQAKPPSGKSKASNSRTVMAQAVSRVATPPIVAPVKGSADPRLQVADAAAKQLASQARPMSGLRSKALTAAVTDAVIRAVPKFMSKAVAQATVAKIQGPPPKMVHSVIPVGVLGSVAASLPPVSEEVLTNAVVKPLVTPAAWGGWQRASSSGQD